MIISASRRTDIPAFYGDWFLERLKAGFVKVKNPFNPNQTRHIYLSHEYVDCFVFWTKNPMSFFPHLKQVMAYKYPFYFHFTVNAYGKEYEPNVPAKTQLAQTFKELTRLISPFPIIWRYDPIIVDNLHSISWHIDNYNDLCNSLKGFTNKCITSFITMYTKCRRRLKNHSVFDLSDSDKIMLLQKMRQIASNNQIELNICASKNDFSHIGVMPAKCIDNELVENITGKKFSFIKDNNQRKNCNCVKSIDIGEYNTCLQNCFYCYANK